MTFIFAILIIASVDSIFGFALFLLWKYLDVRYFSTSEIEILKEENEYLKKENKKLSGSSSIWEAKHGSHN